MQEQDISNESMIPHSFQSVIWEIAEMVYFLFSDFSDHTFIVH